MMNEDLLMFSLISIFPSKKRGGYDTGEHNAECGVLRRAEAHRRRRPDWVTDQSPSQLCTARRPGRGQHYCLGDRTLHSVCASPWGAYFILTGNGW